MGQANHPAGMSKVERAATPTGQEDRAVDNYTSSLSAGAVMRTWAL